MGGACAYSFGLLGCGDEDALFFPSSFLLFLLSISLPFSFLLFEFALRDWRGRQELGSRGCE